MSNKEKFDFMTEQMRDNAVRKFQATKQYHLLQDKLDQMHQDCEGMLTKGQQEFAYECFTLLSAVHGQQELYVYRQGLRDGIRMLKRLGMLV
ncbi:hypothetical protein [Candidatus Soleaferrea massiliensis]|uniref:hypothetical protein n=1 Tax=Candidatus Soleaferrea massiliensis TaxID=1470354 RepID=UPI00058CEEF3|nr:hypothetical protein [Candidatus Soleaferrea massiliensis]